MFRLSFVALGLTTLMLGAGILPGSARLRGNGQGPPQAPPLPSVTLPPELDRVLRDYETNWKANNAEALSALFTDDGFINRNGWIRGRDAIRAAYARSGGDLRLRAVGFATGDTVGYIVGGYRYGEATTDGGKFVLALRRAPRGEWKIAVDLDAANRQ
jgi:ketosteroid isomerase-like protein